MLNNLTYALGAILLAVGVLGFINDPVLGLFEVNLLHNIVHIATGGLLLAFALVWKDMHVMGLRVLGVLYAAIAVLGFVMGEGMLLGLIETNMLDHVLHLGLAGIFLYMGFMMSTEQNSALSTQPML